MRRLFAVMTAGALLAGSAGAPASAFAGSAATACNGSLPPGTYGTITVPAGATCDLGVGPVVVFGGVVVSPGASFLLGHEGGPATGTLSGGIVAVGAAQVVVHFASIHGAVLVQGGAGPFGCTAPFEPVCYTDFEDDTITGGVTITGYNGFWLGFIRNRVNGTVMLTNNDVTNDFFTDEIDVGDNDVHGNQVCSGNVPTENTGGSPIIPSRVTGQDTCHYST